MNKLTKGAIAAAAGIVLLMGGAGTLASWNASADVGASQTISAGSLKIAPTGTDGIWKNSTDDVIAGTRVVPGDTVTFVQDYTLTAIGDNLKFTLDLTPGAITAATQGDAADEALAAVLNTGDNNAVTFALNSAPNITEEGATNVYDVNSNTGTTTITVTMTVKFPFGDTVDNSTQGGQVALGAGAITLKQVQ